MTDPSDRERRARDEEGLSSLAGAYRKAAPYMAACTQLVASTGIFSGLGYWADQKLNHRTPGLFIAGFLLGMTAGFIGFFRTVLGANKK